MSSKPKKVVPKGGWQAAAGKHTTLPQDTLAAKAVVTTALDVNLDEVNKRKLVWRFAMVDPDGPWAPTNISPRDMAVLLRKLVAFESMTVGEIFAPGSEHGKLYEVEKIPTRAAVDRLEATKHDDETHLHRLRCSGRQRLYGILREHVFHVLWWDPEHEVWPSFKRNT